MYLCIESLRKMCKHYVQQGAFWITVVKFDILRREKSSRSSGDLKSSRELNSHEPVDLSPLVECLWRRTEVGSTLESFRPIANFEWRLNVCFIVCLKNSSDQIADKADNKRLRDEVTTYLSLISFFNIVIKKCYYCTESFVDSSWWNSKNIKITQDINYRLQNICWKVN